MQRIPSMHSHQSPLLHAHMPRQHSSFPDTVYQETLDQKAAMLAAIAAEIERCQVCKEGKVGKAVPGEGNPDANIVFIGEAPGKTEAATGKPFIGRSGKLLRSLIRDAGIQESEIFITSPVKYLPQSGTPTQQDIDHGKNHLEKQLAVIKPKLLVLLGAVACKGVLHQTIPVKKRHGDIFSAHGKQYFITIHPAAAVRFFPLREIITQDFEKLKTLL